MATVVREQREVIARPRATATAASTAVAATAAPPPPATATPAMVPQTSSIMDTIARTVAPPRSAPIPSSPSTVREPSAASTAVPSYAPTAPAGENVYTTMPVPRPSGLSYDPNAGGAGYVSTPVTYVPPVTTQPAPVAQTSQDAIISASSGGAVAPSVTTPSIQSPSPDLPSIPSAEQMLVENAAGPTEGKAGGGSILVGAGAGFVVGGPIGAVVGALIAGAMSKKAEPPPVQGFDGWLKNAVKKVGGALKQATKYTGRQLDITSSKSFIRKAGRASDITYSKSLLGKVPYAGKALVGLSRQAVATAKVGTGYTLLEYGASKVIGGRAGAYLAADVKRTIPEAAKGYATGAAVGLAIASGGGAAEMVSAGGNVLAAAVPQATAAQDVIAASSMPEMPTATPVNGAGGPVAGKSGAGAALAGAGAGFLVGGPVGAIAGGAIGYALSKR